MDRLQSFLDRVRRVDWRGALLPVGSILVGILLVNVLFYVFLTRPRLEVAAGSRDVFERTERSLRSERDATREVRDRLSQVRCISADLEEFRHEVLSTKMDRMTKVQKSIRELARAYNMNPDNISYTWRESQDGSLLSFEIRFPLEGSYSDLRQFLYHIETSEHFLLVEQVGLQGSRRGGAALNLDIRLSTYFAQEPPAQAEVASLASEKGQG